MNNKRKTEDEINSEIYQLIEELNRRNPRIKKSRYSEAYDFQKSQLILALTEKLSSGMQPA